MGGRTDLPAIYGDVLVAMRDDPPLGAFKATLRDLPAFTVEALLREAVPVDDLLGWLVEPRPADIITA